MQKNEIVKKDSFSVSLSTELQANRAALPKDFNIERFVQNALALLNGNDTLQEFAKKYGTAQIKAGLMRGAFQGLDALNSEVYLIPYGSTLNYMPSFKGMAKMAKRYSIRPIKDIYAKLVRDGDSFEEIIQNGIPTVNFKAKPFNDGEIIGCFAVALFEDGGLMYETMSRADVENCRKSSKAKNSPAWSQHWGQMACKTVIRRLCKNIEIDMDAESKEFFEAGTEIETNVVEVSRREIEENANSVEFMIEEEPQKPAPKVKAKKDEPMAQEIVDPPVPMPEAQEEMDFD